MCNINLLYDDVLNDVDVVCVPACVAEDIMSVTQKFFSWMNNKDNIHDYRVTNAKGETVLVIETESFIWWLNEHFIKSDKKAFIVSQHDEFNPDYPTAYF